MSSVRTDASEQVSTVRGILVRGHGVASGRAATSPYPAGTIALQRPAFARLGLDLSHVWPGTLNVSIAPATFRMVRPALTFRDVFWHEAHPPETFSFSPCEVAYEGRRYQALVYYPHPETKALHFQEAGTLEILAPWIDRLHYGAPVELRLASGEIEILQG